MAITNLINIKPKIWIPSIFTTNFRLTVERADGTIDDITDIAKFLVEDSVTEGIGRFEFEIPNSTEAFTGVWTGMETFRYYKDYASGTPTTLRLIGRLEKITQPRNNLKASGRSESLFVQDKTVTQSFTNQDTSDVLLSIFSTYGESRYTTTGVTAVSGKTVTKNWFQKPFWECVEELCNDADFDAIIYADLNVNYFARETVNNVDDALIHDLNIFETSEFGEDLQFVKNRVIVYGALKQGVQIIATAEDTSRQQNSGTILGRGVREKIVRDDNITDETQAQDVADATLAEEKNPPQIGTVKGFLLATPKAGEMLNISDPQNNIIPKRYRVLKWTDEGGNDGFFTTITINKEPKSVSQVFKDRISTENKRQETTINPNEMRFSFSFFYDMDEGAHVNTEITQSVLQLQSNQSSGNWVSPQKSTATLVSNFELKASGTKLTGAVFEVSADGGVNYQTLIPNDGVDTIVVDQGINLKLKITISDSETQIDSVSVLYKLS